MRVASCIPKLRVEWIEISNHRVLGFNEIKHYTRAAYLRLTMIDALDPKISRVLYLDVDMVINGRLRPLWLTDLEDKPCAAVIDSWVKGDEFASKWSLPPGHYFNSGVLLCDLDRLRETLYLQRAADILAKPNNQCDFVDQCALNVVLWN
jgi:lipopolysaccharide biosynthesis glycosyltransferase